MKIKDIVVPLGVRILLSERLVDCRRVFRRLMLKVAPVYRDPFSDNCVGFITLHDVLIATTKKSRITVRDVVREHPLLTPEMSIEEAYKIMVEFGLEEALVVTSPFERKVVGTVSLFDIVEKLKESGVEPRAKSVAEVYTSLEEEEKVMVCSGKERVDRIWWRIVGYGAKAAIVLSSEGKIQGIITPEDFIETSRWFFKREAKQEILSRGPKVAYVMKAFKLMRRGIPLVTLDTPVSVVADFMVKTRTSVLPVIDENEKLVGIITIEDIARAYIEGRKPERVPVTPVPAPIPIEAYSEGIVRESTGTLLQLVAVPRKVAPKKTGITAKDIIRTDIPVVYTKDTLEHCRKTLLRYKVSHCIVVDDTGNIVGIVSKRDILYYIAERGRYWKRPKPYAEPVMKTRFGITFLEKPALVEEIVEKDIPRVKKDATLEEIAYQMVANDVDAVFVEDEQGNVIGLITKDDLVKAYLKHSRDIPLVENIVMPREYSIVHPHHSLLHVLRKMRSLGLDAVTVAEGNNVIGVISESKLVFTPIEEYLKGRKAVLIMWTRKLIKSGKKIARYIRILPLTAQDACIPVKAKILLKDSVAKAIELMIEEGVDGLPVFDEEGKLVGTVCKMDIVREMARAVPVPEVFEKVEEKALEVETRE